MPAEVRRDLVQAKRGSRRLDWTLTLDCGHSQKYFLDSEHSSHLDIPLEHMCRECADVLERALRSS